MAGNGVDVALAVSVAMGVTVTVGVRVGVGARREAEGGRRKLNKHENTTAASSSANRILNICQRVFKMSSSSLFPKVNGGKTCQVSGWSEC